MESYLIVNLITNNQIAINIQPILTQGFQITMLTTTYHIQMSAIEDQSHEMGVTACQLLLKSINGDTKVYKEIVPQQLVIRETSAKNRLK